MDLLKTFLERFELFVDANKISRDKIVLMLLNLIGIRTYKILKAMVFLKLVRDLPYKEIQQILTNHYKPKAIIVLQSYRF